MAKSTHAYQLLDQVWYEADNCPFTVVGIRLDEVEIRGDFSGGTHAVTQTDWVPANQVEPWQAAFQGRIRKLHDPTPGSRPDMYRYVAAGTPTLLNTYENWLSQRQGLGWNAQDNLSLLGRQPQTLRQMLRHERPLYVIEFMKLCYVLKLSIDEAQARYWANAPAEKIAAQQTVESNIAQLHMMAEVRKLLETK